MMLKLFQNLRNTQPILVDFVAFHGILNQSYINGVFKIYWNMYWVLRDTLVFFGQPIWGMGHTIFIHLLFQSLLLPVCRPDSSFA